MEELFNITNCYQDDNYYYFFRALNKRDMTGIRNKSILDDAGHINKIITDSKFYNHTDRYNEESSLTLEEMFNHIKTHYDKDTNCISLSSDANVCLTYGRSDYEDKYIIVKVPKNELGSTTFNAGKYMFTEITNRTLEYIKTHQNDLTDLQRYYIDSLSHVSTREQLDNLKKTLPEESVNQTDEKFQNGFNFIKSKPYEGYSDEENLAKDKLVMLLDILDFEAIKGKTNRFAIQTMSLAFSAREFDYYKDIPGEKIIEMPTSLIEIMAILQQVPETKEIREIKTYILTHLDTIKQNIKEIDYSNFNTEGLDLSLDNLYKLTEGKISYKDAKELYINSMYLVKAKLRTYFSINLLNNILNNNPKYSKTLQYILDNTLGIEPTIMARSGNNTMKVSDTIFLYLPKKYQSLYDYINSLKASDMSKLFISPSSTFNTLFTKYIDDKNTIKQDKEEWYANALIDAIDLESLNIETSFNEVQRRKIVNALVSHNFMDYYESVKTVSDDGLIATSMFASLIAKKDEFTSDTNIIIDKLKDYIGYNEIKEYKLLLRKIQRRAYENVEKAFASRNFTTAIMPTGSGKSFLALAEMLDHKNENILYIAPNKIILDQIEYYISKYLSEQGYTYNDYHTVFPNLSLVTYQDLKDFKTDNLKEKYADKYDFIILDELHRSGAPKWRNLIQELMANQDKKKVKVLGLTATPERDIDDADMAVYWARYFGYSDTDIILSRHLAIDETLESAINAGILPNPIVVNCLYKYKSDGTLDDMFDKISLIDDAEAKAKAYAKYELCCRKVSQSRGIEKILGDYLKPNDKYVVFLPVTRKENDNFATEDGTKINRVQAVKIIEDYTILIRQYLYSNEYMKTNGESLLSIYNKIINKQELSDDDIDFLNKEQENIMLLDMLKIKHKPAALNTFNTTMVSTITRHLGWKKLDRETIKVKIESKTQDMVDTNSLLSYYSDSKNKEELDSFNKETTGKPKLLFAMDKLNEGAHLEGVKGIIWLRTLSINSKILFYQQLGRCMHSGSDGHVYLDSERPVVLDLVNNRNIVNLKRNETPQNDLRALRTIISWIKDNGDKRPNKNSKILEEKNYGLKLNIILYRYIKYFNNHSLLNDINIQNKIVIEEILKLGSSIDLWNIKINETERVIKLKDEEKEEDDFLQGFMQVDSIVSDFINLKKEIDELISSEEAFDKWYKLASKYYKEYGNLLVPRKYVTKSNENLGTWISNQRSLYKSGNLSKEKIKMLEEIGMVWNKLDSDWQEKYRQAKEYYQKHGNLSIDSEYVAANGEVLRTWINKQLQLYKKGMLSAEKIEMLEGVGIVWDIYSDKWQKMYQLAEKYYQKYKNLSIPRNYIAENHKPLGNWINRQRHAYAKGKLSKDKIELLEAIGMVWNATVTRWQEMYLYATEYYKEHQNLLVTKDYIMPNGENLKIWVKSQREAYSQKKLSQEKIKMLESIGMVWNVYNNQWTKMYKLATEYYKTHGNLLVPVSYVTKDNEPLGKWISKRRGEYVAGKLSQERIEQLESIGMKWSLKDDEWNRMYGLATEYYEKYGNLMIPSDFITETGEELGLWIKNKRNSYYLGRLSDEKIKLLEKIGMIWNLYDNTWNNMYQLAKNYYEKNGNLFISQRFVTASGEALGQWISRQRQELLKGRITEERIKLLDNIGMIWNTKTNKDEIDTYLEDLKNQNINIDKKLNKDILKRISILELKSKINYLLERKLPILDNNGKLIDIFSMTSIDIKEKYNISLDEIITTYNKSKTL